ncbi:MAG: hypothetical protein RL216_3120 [Pseudomonadota bacterium]|jgi:LysR family nitrogen assimilation transcriptional regulator
MSRIDPRGVDVRRLRYFIAVCAHGGMSRAAAVVGVAQPALTRQIQLLEQELGVPLLTRNGRGATPTEAGQILLAEARAHLDSLDALVDRVRRDFAGDGPKITLGICPTIAPLFLGPVQDMSRHLPGAPVLTVIEAYSGDLRNLMAAGQLDLALSYGTQGTEGVRETLLLSERLVVATRTAPPEARMTLRQIAGLKLILPSRIHQLRRIIDAICAGRGQPLTPVLELDSLSAVRAMLRQEPDYSTILPYHAVAADEADPGLDPVLIDDPDMVRRIALLQPERGVALPEGLVGAIRARAEDIRKTMEAVC